MNIALHVFDHLSFNPLCHPDPDPNRNLGISCVSVTVSTFVRILSYLVTSPATEIWPCCSFMALTTLLTTFRT